MFVQLVEPVPQITLTMLDSLWHRLILLIIVLFLNNIRANLPAASDSEEDQVADINWINADEALDDDESVSDEDEDTHVMIIGYTNQGFPITFQELPYDMCDPYTWDHEQLYAFRTYIHQENHRRAFTGEPLLSIHPGHNGAPVRLEQELFISGLTGEATRGIHQ